MITQMYTKGVSKKVIAEQSGHKSLRSYKCTDEKLIKEAERSMADPEKNGVTDPGKNGDVYYYSATVTSFFGSPKLCN